VRSSVESDRHGKLDDLSVEHDKRTHRGAEMRILVSSDGDYFLTATRLETAAPRCLIDTVRR
jgi:hypothetical protein